MTRRIAKSVQIRTAKAQGKAARAAGMSVEDCPYKPGTQREAAWKEGFNPELAERLATKGKADEPKPTIIDGVWYASRTEARRALGWQKVRDFRKGRDLQMEAAE